MKPSINVLYEDEFLGVINKPSLIHSVAQKKSHDSIEDRLKEARPTQRALPDGGLIQRLDFETSGALIFAKTEERYHQLSMMIKHGAIKKEYVLIVDGAVLQPFTVIGFFGGRYRGSEKVSFSKTKKPRFLEGETDFIPLFSSKSSSLLLARTKTGRRHQVRVSAAHAKHPLTGDQLYGGSLDGSHFVLHAFSVSIPEMTLHVIAPFFEESVNILLKRGIPFEKIPFERLL